MTILHLCPIGILVEDEDKVRLIEFDKDIDGKARNLYKMIKGELDIKNMVPRDILKKEVITTSPILFNALQKSGLKIKLIRREVKIEKLIEKSGKYKDPYLILEEIRDIMKIFTEIKIREELTNKDLLIIHAINSYDEYTEIINLFYERLREWYGTYFPELSGLITKMDRYINIISEIGDREKFNYKNLKRIGYPEEKIELIINAAKYTTGGTLSENDLKIIINHAKTTREIIRQRDRIEKYIEELAKEIAPNMTALIGPKLTARLIAKAGSLRKLAMFPASTIQLLGAEKALFLALRKGRKPPKHGIIFQHPYINQSPKLIRGKIARLLAGKITIAARTDAFGGDFIGDKLHDEIRKRVEELRNKARKMIKKKRREKKKWR